MSIIVKCFLKWYNDYGDNMRRSKSNNKVVYIIIAVIVVGIIAGKFFIGGGSEKKYTKYVKEFEDAIYEYCENDLNSNSESISFDELKNLLLSKDYVKEFEDPSVLLSADDIQITKKDGEISFYNYSNAGTYENGFMIKFNHNNKIYNCTKNKCK